MASRLKRNFPGKLLPGRIFKREGRAKRKFRVRRCETSFKIQREKILMCNGKHSSELFVFGERRRCGTIKKGATIDGSSFVATCNLSQSSRCRYNRDFVQTEDS